MKIQTWIPTSSILYCVTCCSIEFNELWRKTLQKMITINFRNMTNIGTLYKFPVQSLPFRQKIPTTIGSSSYLNCDVKKNEKIFFFSNRAVYGSYRLICDVNNNRTNYMFISCVKYAAYRRLAESFHWSNLYSDRLHGNHKCRQWQLPRSPGTLRKKVLYERINIKGNYPLCNQQIVHFLYIRHLQRCVTVNSYEF